MHTHAICPPSLYIDMDTHFGATISMLTISLITESINSGWKVMKYLLNKKAACLFVGETQCDTCAVRDKMDATEDLLLDRTITNEL